VDKSLYFQEARELHKFNYAHF